MKTLDDIDKGKSMFLQPHTILIESILTVSTCSDQYLKGHQVMSDYNGEQIINSVTSVSNIVNSKKNDKHIKPMPPINSIYRVSWTFSKTIKLSSSVFNGPSLLQEIGKESDENLHSDILAALLNPARVGSLAFKLFDKLSQRSENSSHSPQDTFQIPYRELRLDQINRSIEGQSHGSRRIDILVKRNKEILVIENKIWSSESESQTFDYYEAVKSRYNAPKWDSSFIFLSPDGLLPQHREFVALSYPALYEILLSLLENGPWSETGERLLNLYCSEISELFVRPRENKIKRIMQRLEEVGYYA